MKDKIALLMIVICLCDCSKRDPVVSIAEDIKSDIVVVEHQIQDIKDNLPIECQTPAVNSNLNTIQANLKTISVRVDEQVVTCNSDRDLLKEKNSKLRIINGFLILILILTGLIIVKRK